MEQEITNVNLSYNIELQTLITKRDQYYKTIRSWLISFRIKQNYTKYVARWFHRDYTILTTNRDNKIREIRLQYSNANMNSNANSNSNANLNSNANPVKKALLVGINYVGTTAELRGCVNDVNDLKDLLMTKYGYTVSNIVTLTDNRATKQNIMTQLTKLIQNGKSGDNLFFSFSGHGYFTKDLSRDEIDGKDELIISVDNLPIVDDELKSLIDTNLKKNVTLIAIMDTCHSGTVLDLPYQYFKGEQEIIHHSANIDTKGTAICLSGCRDDQVSMDAYLQGDFNGAMTFYFVELLKTNNSLTWKACVEQLREKLENANFTQIPQITCGKKMDLNTLPVAL